MASDIYTNNELKSFGSNIQAAITDADNYLNNTVKQATYLTQDNYQEMETAFNIGLQTSTQKFQILVDNLTQEAGINELQDILDFGVSATGSYDENKQSVIDASSLLTTAAKQLAQSVQAMKDDPDLATILSDNRIPDNDIQTKLDDLSVDETQLPTIDFNDINDNLILESEAVFTELDQSLTEGLETLESFPQDFADEYSDPIMDTIEEVGQLISDETQAIVSYVEELSLGSRGNVQQDIDDVVDKWGPIIFGLLLIPAMILIIIMILYLFGVICGVTGKVRNV